MIHSLLYIDLPREFCDRFHHMLFSCGSPVERTLKHYQICTSPACGILVSTVSLFSALTRITKQILTNAGAQTGTYAAAVILATRTADFNFRFFLLVQFLVTFGCTQ